MTELVNSLEIMVFGSARATKSKLMQIKKQQGLLLIAYDQETPVGFKLGYVIEGSKTFFSWLGGVHPDFRRRGIARSLLKYQEGHVIALGINTIYFTSFDRYSAMMNLGKQNDYVLVKSALDKGEVKYWYEKQLF